MATSAPLDRIADLGRHYGAITMVDDAHASGVLGSAGAARSFTIACMIAGYPVGTLSKAIGAVGGYVSCSQKLRR